MRDWQGRTMRMRAQNFSTSLMGNLLLLQLLNKAVLELNKLSEQFRLCIRYTGKSQEKRTFHALRTTIENIHSSVRTHCSILHRKSNSSIQNRDLRFPLRSDFCQQLQEKESMRRAPLFFRSTSPFYAIVQGFCSFGVFRGIFSRLSGALLGELGCILCTLRAALSCVRNTIFSCTQHGVFYKQAPSSKALLWTYN